MPQPKRLGLLFRQLRQRSADVVAQFSGTRVCLGRDIYVRFDDWFRFDQLLVAAIALPKPIDGAPCGNLHKYAAPAPYGLLCRELLGSQKRFLVTVERVVAIVEQAISGPP